MKHTTTITDAGDLRKYRTELPNILDDSDLSVHAFRLYVHIKRRAGDGGVCSEGLRGMAKACRMAIGTTQKARAELIKGGYITVEEVIAPGKGGGKFEHITVVDLWEQNFEHFAALKKSKRGVSRGDTEERTKREEVCRERATRANTRRRESSEPKTSLDSTLSHPAVLAYREICDYPPNKQQRAEIVATVTDLALWRSTLERFALEGQRKHHVDWALERSASKGVRGVGNATTTQASTETRAEKEARLKREIQAKGAQRQHARQTA